MQPRTNLWSTPAVRSLVGIAVKLGGAAVAFLFYAFIGRSLSLVEAGTIFFCMAFVLVLSALARFGLDHAIVKKVSQSGQLAKLDFAQYAPAFLLVALVSGLLFLIILGFSSQLVFLFGIPLAHRPVFVLFGAAVPATALYTCLVFVLNGLERNVLAACLQTFFPQVVAFSFSFGLIYFFKNISPILAFSLAFCFSSLGVLCLAAIFCRPSFVRSPSAKEGARNFFKIDLIKEAGALFPGSVADLCINLLPVVLVGFFSVSSEVAQFSVPQRICGIIFFVFSSINAVAAPRLGRAFKNGGFVELRRIYKISTLGMVLGIVPVCLLVAGLGEFVLGFFGGAYKSAIHVLWLLLLGQAINAAFGPVLFTLVMSGNRKLYNVSMYIGAILTVLLMAALCPFYGAIGGGVAVCLGVFFQKLSAYLFFRKVVGRHALA